MQALDLEAQAHRLREAFRALRKDLKRSLALDDDATAAFLPSETIPFVEEEVTFKQAVEHFWQKLSSTWYHKELVLLKPLWR